jgi:hypothetical protein
MCSLGWQQKPQQLDSQPGFDWGLYRVDLLFLSGVFYILWRYIFVGTVLLSALLYCGHLYVTLGVLISVVANYFY